ncbi:cleft lip and palate transmembrane protein 1-domain-containing protein [Chaetomium sp. MPI-SDFR-AT-0129]|nr:cleft lip and palate transmembrane protein 1-domain-containing protein [Chaetomium sp. MPI-SDFR-AT-0129]
MPAETGQTGAEPARQEGQSSIFRTVFQGIAIYMAIQFVMKQFIGGPQTTTVKDASGKTVQVATSSNVPPYSERPASLNEGATYNRIPQSLGPIWPDNSVVDIIVTVSPSFGLTPLKDLPEDGTVLEEKEFRIGNWSDKRAAERTIYVPTPVQHNGTLWGHFYVGLSGALLDPTQKGYDPASAYHFVYPLTQHIPKKKEAKTRSLLSDAPQVEEPASEEPEQTGPIIANYYHPNISLSFIPNTGVVSYPQSHPAVRQFLRLEVTGARDGTGQNSWYYPILYVNTFWQLKTHMTILNDTVKTLPIRVDLNNLAEWKFKTMASIDMSGKESARQAAYGHSLPGGGDGSEIEMIKEIFIDTNPILLGITAVVSVAHMILETLAFGSDIAHYRKKKDNVGISVRSILANVFMQTVIFLYLIDQSQNTSWMILGGQAIGILIELWKITTVVNVRVRPAPPGSLIPYYVSFEDKHKLSETEEKTKEYDEIAFKYMYWAGIPLLLAYAVYSLFYDTHKSWYSYVITTLVGSVYAYGFLMMVPSLYINYRLKSVAHMPGKAMIYKFLNTFIDDLFAFTIKMPFLHRLATFRDDIIFFIYLYQRWAYKIDYTRVNEFGQGGEDEDEPEKEAADKKEEKKGAKETKALPVGSVENTATTTGAQAPKATKRK